MNLKIMVDLTDTSSTTHYESEDDGRFNQIHLHQLTMNLKIMVDLTDTSSSTHYESEDDDGVKTRHN